VDDAARSCRLRHTRLTRTSSSAAPASYGRGARIASIGIGLTGLVTLAYFAVADQVLGPDAYGGIAALWSVTFIVASVLYRPVEQLLSRSIAAGRASGAAAHPLRVPVTLQLSFAALFLVAVLALRGPITDDLFGGADALYGVLVGAVVAYAASYFARGWLAGHQRMELYGALVFFEAVTRLLFPLAVAVGVATGQTAVALGILAAPLASLLVVPPALRRQASAASAASVREAEPTPSAATGPTLRAGGAFAGAVLVIQAAEQTILNVAVLTVPTVALAGVVFNVLLIARAPLQLFQAVQTTLLPHLTGADRAEFARAVRVTVLAIAGFAAAVALGLLLVGPFVMDLVFGGGYDYARAPLVVVALGMGFHLAAGTLNQAALARGRQAAAAAAWVVAAAVFVAFLVAPLVDDRVLRVAVGYAGAAALLAVLLGAVLRR
jgi:O-antigen/teichoic acid export membrane protein